jgi:hypothetical protein
VRVAGAVFHAAPHAAFPPEGGSHAADCLFAWASGSEWLSRRDYRLRDLAGAATGKTLERRAAVAWLGTRTRRTLNPTRFTSPSSSFGVAMTYFASPDTLVGDEQDVLSRAHDVALGGIGGAGRHGRRSAGPSKRAPIPCTPTLDPPRRMARAHRRHPT